MSKFLHSEVALGLLIDGNHSTSDHESKPDAPTEDLKLREERVATYMEVSKDHWDHLQLRLMGSSSAKDGATGSGSSPRSKM